MSKEYEIVQAEEINTPVSDEEMLAVFAPMALKEGALLVEFKKTYDDSIRDAVIVTLNEQECPIDHQPENHDNRSTWCWNIRTNQWYKLEYSKIESMQPWPPEFLD